VRSATPAPTVRISDVTPEAVTVALTAWVPDNSAAGVVGSDLRERAMAVLRQEGMLARA